MRRNRPALALIAALAALSLFGAACSGDEEPVRAEEPEVEPTPEPDPVCPLTGGEPRPGVKLSRPAVAVKVENDPAARPLSGLEDADLVVEERVEGGITRFMAIYHCGDSELAGSVRSGRFDDPKIASPYTRLIAASGSNQIVENEMHSRGIVYLDEDSTGALFRNPAGATSVHSLFANTKLLRKEAWAQGLEPPTEGIFTFGEIENKARKAVVVSLNFVHTNTIDYRWEDGAWKRYEQGAPFMTAAGEQVAVPNVLVQEVRIDNSTTISDVAGNPSPDIAMTGRGKALLFRDGRVIRGRWQIDEEGGAPAFTDRKGNPMVFAEGPIWIALVPSKEGTVQGDVNFSKEVEPAL